MNANLLKNLSDSKNMPRKVVFMVIACILLSSSGSHNFEVGVAHGLRRIGMDEPVPGVKEVVVTTARNEYEPFQIVMRSEEEMEDITVTITDLYDKEGHIFSKRNFTLFEVHYVYVKTPSPRSGASPGWYPDGLKPLRGVDITPGENKVVWVDVYTPEHQNPGVYTGLIRIEIDDLVEIPLMVNVWDFTLPQKTSLRSSFGVFHHEIYRVHNLDWDSPELEDVFYNYYETLISHRIMPGDLLFGMPEVHEDGSIDTKESHKHLKYFMDTLQVNSSAYPIYSDWPFEDPFGKDVDKTTRYLRSLYEYYAAHGWEDRFFVYVIDEPNDRRAYEEVRDAGEILDSIHPGIIFLVTEQLTPDDVSWGDLYGYVDIWCPLFFCIEDEKKLIRERQELGDEFWTYTALCQGEKETSYWELDFPVLNYRVTMWMIWKSKISGLLYWGTNYWSRVDDPWEDHGTWGEGEAVYNGEGSLLYPAENGCLPSIRLKVLREGMEDYEYFVMLKSLGEESFVDKHVRKIVKSWYQWETNPEKLLDVRIVLGEKINSLTSEVPSKEEEEEEKEEKIKENQEKKDEVVVEEKEEKDELFIEEPTVERSSEPAGLQNNFLVYGVIAAGIFSGLLGGLLWRRKTQSTSI